MSEEIKVPKFMVMLQNGLFWTFPDDCEYRISGDELAVDFGEGEYRVFPIKNNVAYYGRVMVKEETTEGQIRRELGL
ncbi:hypothetical protein SEA_MICHLEY_45 [Mycobacterium phage Michley]|nr:hypothetical protein SEA_MICHLEY_45 [Mycobacterium phage Michley]